MLLFVLSFFAAKPLVLPADELRPWTVNRRTLNFNAEWRFLRGEIAGDQARHPSFQDSEWQVVHLPHCPRITPLRQPWKPDNEGISWYRKHFTLPEDFKGRKLFLEFEGADQVADVWINGIHLTTHSGAYLPFFADFTDVARFGGSANVVAVKVDNRDDKDIPGYGRWISFGGLYRDVRLRVMDRLHVTDAVAVDRTAGGGVFVTTPLVCDSLARVRVRTHVLNEYSRAKDCLLRTRIVDAAGQVLKTAEVRRTIRAGGGADFDQVLQIEDFTPWHPNHPVLYRIRSELLDGARLADAQETRFGIRDIRFRRDGGFSVNGERLTFTGVNRVQEYPYVAWAFPNAAQRRDALLIKEGGFQYVRTSHNPQDPSFLDACDELGILVMDCIPGFQYIGGPAFTEACFKNMRDMIRRDRNHPSVVLWELSLNETDYDSAFARTAVRIGHEEFPADQCFVAGWKYPEVYDVFLRASQHGAREYTGSTPLVISEYGHWDFGGGNSTSDVDRRDGEAAMLVQAQNHQQSLCMNRGLPFLCGDGLWVGMDFQCYPSGIIDYFRIPKFSYYFFQSQRDPRLLVDGADSGPMVFIANNWTEKSPRPVTVYSNCERVDLYLNGRLLLSQKPDTGQFDGNLSHPPFTFRDAPWSAGELKAIGFLDGKEAASHLRITPGEADRVEVRFNLKGPAAADGEDLFFAYASVMDRNGTVVFEGERTVSFRVSGPGVLVAPEAVRSEAGIAATLIRTTGDSGTITVEARTEGLPAGTGSVPCVPVKSTAP
jgi:beta-galactosidase